MIESKIRKFALNRHNLGHLKKINRKEMRRYKVLALDLEGTLVSNAVSMFPRPGLYSFLEDVRTIFDNVVIFSAVNTTRLRKILNILEYHNDIPTWFARVEIVNWSGDIKDLAFIDCALIEECIIVDDIEAYIKTDQKAQWLPIEEFYNPYKQVDDEELTRILNTLETLQRNE